MKNFVLAASLTFVCAEKSYPYINDIGWLAISVSTKGATPGWEMGFASEISQLAKSTPMTFGIGMGIYPATNSFVDGHIYQSFVQF